MILWTVRLLAALIGLPLLLVVVGAWVWVQTDHGRGLLRDLVVAVVPGLELAAIDGGVPFDIQATDLALADRDGVWLTADRVRLAWSFWDLFSGTLHIEAAEAGWLTIHRPPVAAAEETDPDDGPLALPDLPVGIVLDRLAIDTLVLGEALIGTPVEATVSAGGRLGRPADGLALAVEVTRTDATPGHLVLDAAYVPEGERLAIDLVAAEPPGGMIAGLLGLPGAPAVDLTVDGSGTLDDFAAELALDAGPDLSARLSAVAAGRRLGLTGDLVPDALLADPGLRALVDDGVAIDAAAAIAEDGSVALESVTLTGAFGRLAAEGRIGAAAETIALDLTLDAEAAAFAGLTGGIGWRNLALDARIEGPLDRPDARVAVEVAGLSPIDSRLAPLLGEAPVTVDLQGSMGLDGAVAIDRLALDLAGAALMAEATAAGFGTEGVDATAVLSVPALDVLAGPTGLAGGATIALEAAWDGEHAAVDLAADFLELATGLPVLDGLVGGAPRLAGRLTVAADGGLVIDNLALDAPGLTLTGGGRLAEDAVEATLSATVAELQRLDSALAGTAALDLRASGRADEPAVEAVLTLTDAVLGGRPLPVATLTVDAEDLLTAPQAALRLALASLTAEGAVAIEPETGTVDGALAGRVERLADLAALAGQPLTGGLEFDLSLAGEAGRQDARLQATLAGAGLDGQVTAGFAEVSGLLTDLMGVPAIDATVTAQAVAAGDADLDRLRLSAAGGLEALDLDLETEGRVAGEAANLSAAATLDLAGDAMAITLSGLNAGAAGLTANLVGPATLSALPGGDLMVGGLALDIGEGGRTGRLDLDGRYGAVNDLTVALTALPLGLLETVVPGLGLDGTADLAARLTGTRTAPALTADLTAGEVVLAETRAAGLPPADLAVGLDWQGGQLALDGTLAGLTDQPVRLALALAAPADPATGLPVLAETATLSGEVSGELPLARLNPLLAGGGTRLDGTLDVDLSLAGTLDEPGLAGRIEVAGGRVANPLVGIALTDIALTLEGQGRDLTLTRFTARTADGGVLSGSGALTADLDAGLPGDFEIAFDEALLIANELATVTLSGTAGLTGPLIEAPMVVGRLVVPRAELRIPETLPPTVPTLAVEEVNLPPELAARRPPAPVEDGAAGAFDAALDITIDAPQQVFVRGRGLDIEVGGRIVVAGRSSEPEITGGFTLRRGLLDALGRRFDFEEGEVTLPPDGSLNPELRFVARTELDDAVAEITLSGRADDPQIAFASVPELPTDEIFARILFEKPTGSLTPFEAVQLAQQVAVLTGVGGGGPDLIGGVRDAVGLDRLDVEAGDDDLESATISGGRYVADGVFLGVEQGLDADASRVTVEIEITDNITVESDVGADSGGRVGVNMQWDY